MNGAIPSWLILVGLFLHSGAVQGGFAGEQVTVRSISPHLPLSPYIRSQAQFWTKIFLHFRDDQSVIHDTWDLSKIVDVVSIDRLQGVRQKSLADWSLRYRNRYNKAAKRFRKYGAAAREMGAIEARVYKVYAQNAKSLKRLLRGDVRFRSQRGLAGEFLRGASRAQDYLTYAEREFRKYGVPVQLTRIAFVESMFNPKARSKVGASGIWQFMPNTGRRYLKMGNHFDERNSPFKASGAAARLLRDNFRQLKSWPLAITAYNYGAYGLQKVVRKTKNAKLESVIFNNKDRRFGFASRNFYAEFAAAWHAYKFLERTGRIALRPSRFRQISFSLPKPMTVGQILRLGVIDKNTIAEHNLCIKPKSFKQPFKAKLPKGYKLYIPLGLNNKFRTAFKRKPKSVSVASIEPKGNWRSE